MAKPLSASTITGRIAGYREALFVYRVGVQEALVRRGDSEDTRFLNHVLDACRPEAIVCADDATAATVMSHLSSNGVRGPEEMRVVGVDDVKYASMLLTPLTTQHQNCANIGAAALSTMLERLENPTRPYLGHSAEDAYGGAAIMRVGLVARQ